MGLEDAAAVRALWRRQRELGRVLEDELESEPVKAEALPELEEFGSGDTASDRSDTSCGPYTA